MEQSVPSGRLDEGEVETVTTTIKEQSSAPARQADTAPLAPVQSPRSPFVPHQPTPTPSRRYALISPCRDEASYARRTIESVIHQSVTPTIWVIVDDGSQDQTPDILAEYAAKYDWIRVIKRTDRGGRVLGAGVIEAFNDGLKEINLDDYDYVCKLDLDLDLPSNYFLGLMQRMEADPRLGACSGKPFFYRGETLHPERCGDEHAVGMTKFYRVDCFKQMGGFVKALMWDGIDTHRIRRLGWKAASWPDPTIQFIHLRPMGTSHKSWWTGRVRHGWGQYFMGTHPLYLLSSAALRVLHPPIVLGMLAILWGYFRALLTRTPRYEEPGFRSFLRRYQFRCLLSGKRHATALTEREMAHAFKPSGQTANK